MKPRPLMLIAGRDVRRAGGHASFVRAHALAVASIGFEPHIFLGSTRPGTEATELGTLHRIPVPPRRHPPALAQIPLPVVMPFLARGVARFAATCSGPCLIHSVGCYATAGALAARALRRRGLEAHPVATAYATRAYEARFMMEALERHHGLANRVRYRLWGQWLRSVEDGVEGWGYGRSSVVLVNYESVRSILVSSYGPRLNIRKVPYAAPDAFTRDGHRPGTSTPDSIRLLQPATAPLIVAISRQVPRKGNDLLLLALADLAAAGVPFRACLLGPGALLGSHRRLATHLGLDGRVVLPGFVPDVAPYLDRADIFVLPSVAESSGSVSVLQALQAGKPVVSTACDGLPEDLVDAENALLVRPGDVLALASAIKRLLADPELRARLGHNAELTYQRRFSAQGFAAALSGIYEELGIAP